MTYTEVRYHTECIHTIHNFWIVVWKPRKKGRCMKRKKEKMGNIMTEISNDCTRKTSYNARQQV